MVKALIEFMNDPVLLLGDILPFATTKCSVKGNEYFSIITINFVGGICYIKCHSGFCATANINKKRILWSSQLSETAKLCSHLQTCYTNINCITAHFSNYFTELEQDHDINEDGNADEDINTEDDGMIDNGLVSNFNKSTGLWSYKSESTHKPMFSDDKNLHVYTWECIQYIVNYDPNAYINIKQQVKNADGTPRKCDCGQFTLKIPILKKGLLTYIHVLV